MSIVSRRLIKDISLVPFCASEDTLSSNKIIKCLESFSNPYSALSEESKLTFHFKHPSVTSCNLPGQCGFILKTVPSKAALWKLELCTEKEDYIGFNVHFHVEIRAEKMHVYFLRRTSLTSYSVFPLTWLSCISSSADRKKWSWFDFQYGSKFCVAYE